LLSTHYGATEVLDDGTLRFQVLSALLDSFEQVRNRLDQIERSVRHLNTVYREGSGVATLWIADSRDGLAAHSSAVSMGSLAKQVSLVACLRC
jgi:hypothetical protein